MSEIKEKLEKDLVATSVHKPAQMVTGFYESSDVNALRLALLAKHRFKLNSITNLVEPIKPTDFSESPPIINTYILPAWGAGNSFDALAEAVCTALLDITIDKQILFPCRMADIAHWVAVHVEIKANNSVTLTIYDSAYTLYKQQAFEDQLKMFFENPQKLDDFLLRTTSLICQKSSKELKKIFFKDKVKNVVFKNLGKSNDIYTIQYDKEKNQLKDVYCGGYAARLVVSLAIDPFQKISEETVWQCGDNDHILRKEDVITVDTYNPSQAYLFGCKGMGEEYQKGLEYKAISDGRQKALQKILVDMEEKINLLEEKLLKEIQTKIRAANINPNDGPAIRKQLFELYAINKELTKPLFHHFFAGNEKQVMEEKQIDENSRLITFVPISDLWRGFVELLARKLFPFLIRPDSEPDVSIEDKHKSSLTTAIAVWEEDLFRRFLRVRIISAKKACRVDCTFEEVNSTMYKKLLVNARNELLKRETGAAIIVVRKIAGSFIFGRVCLEKKSKACRASLELFSIAFSIDQNPHDLTKERLWPTRIKDIKYRESFGKEGLNVLTSIMSSDFLCEKTSSNTFAVTRLRCYSIPEHNKYQETIVLHTFCTHLDLAVEKIVDEKGKIDEAIIIKIEQQYLSLAQHSTIRDATVAKTQQGFSYQEYLVMLISYLAIEDSSTSPFSLIAEAMMPEAEAWNDVVLEWNQQLIFFQQKHRSLYSFSVPESYTTAQVLYRAPKKSKRISEAEETDESSELDEASESEAGESKDDSELENVKKSKKVKKSDASIYKYYEAYCHLLKNIQDPNHPLHCHMDKVKAGNLKFIFLLIEHFRLQVRKVLNL